MFFIVFVLSALALGATHSGDSIYFSAGTMDNNGYITIDIGNVTSLDDLSTLGEKKIADYKPLKKDDPDNFFLVAENENEFKKLKSSASPSSLDYLPDCPGVGEAHLDGIYGLLGFTVKAVNKEDITPSIPYLFKSAPQKLHYVKNGEELNDTEKDIFRDVDSILQYCQAYDLIYASYSLARGGIVDDTCVPNTKLPDDAFKCSESGAKYKAYLKGYRVGSFYGASVENVKKLIARFGVVDIYFLGHVIGYEKKDDKNYWIFADWTPTGFDYKTEEIVSSDTFNGRVIGNGISSLKVALSVVLSAVMLPVLALFW
ncbi:MAG: hypothetical protein EZS28_033892 [Streblomastix strix]|uniref:Uncharacterized protein n=1 Tax=Streblomastix strix TaxID=222440 RepID=A0A5J4UKJ8_9EUKA|nr:MAG: hypothetical protein EZS28_033892 [Streblomastix strix]